MINTIAELSGRDPDARREGAAFANRYRSAFSHALRRPTADGMMTRRQAAHRSELLTAAAMGVWLAVRADPAAAAAACSAVAAEVSSWAPATRPSVPRLRGRRASA